MTQHPDERPTANRERATIVVDTSRRLLVGEWENASARRFVTVAPQHRDRSGEWKLSHSGLILAPEVARELAPALLTVAASIDGAPEDPMPTQQDRDESRMP